MILLALMMACDVDTTAEALPTDLAPPPSLTITGPAFLPRGVASTIEVTGTLGVGEEVHFARASAPGSGPCMQVAGGLCLDIGPSVHYLGAAVFDGARATITLTPPPALSVGTPIAIQAIVVRGIHGVTSVKTGVLTDTVDAYVPGCIDPGADNYDPAATWDDGSCIRDCAGTDAYIYGPADVTPALASCRVLNGLYMHQTAGVTSLSLPLLEQINGALYFHQTTDLQDISLPALQSVGSYLYLHQNADIQSLDIGSLQTVGEYFYFYHNTSLSSWDVGSLAYVGGYTYLDGNSALCVDTSGMDWEAITTSYVYISGNLCN